MEDLIFVSNTVHEANQPAHFKLDSQNHAVSEAISAYLSVILELFPDKWQS